MLSAGCLCNSALTRNGAATFVIASTNAKIAIVDETNGSNAALLEAAIAGIASATPAREAEATLIYPGRCRMLRSTK